MIIYIDENMPSHLAAGFNMLQKPEGLKTGLDIEVKFLLENFDRGSKDVDWIPKVGIEGSCVITQDINISRRRNEIDLYKKHGVGMFFLRSPNKKKGLSIWEMTQCLAKNWEEICYKARKEKRPFAYEFTLHKNMKKLK